MPSFSSFALALAMRSDCLLAHSGLRFPSSTYFMGHLHGVLWSFCERHVQSYAFWQLAPTRIAAPVQPIARREPRCCAEGGLADSVRRSSTCPPKPKGRRRTSEGGWRDPPSS